MKSNMQYLIWSSLLEQLEKGKNTSGPYYNMVYAKVKEHEPKKS